jgi:hypothetical protein
MSGFIKISGIEVAVPVTGPNKILGRVTAGAGPHEEISISSLPADGGVMLGDPNAASFTAANNKGVIRIPSRLNGLNLTQVGASCTTAASSGTTTIQFRRVRAGSGDVNMLSTALTIDSGEIDSSTAAVPAVINTANDDVLTGDQIRFDVTAVGTGTLGVVVTFKFS